MSKPVDPRIRLAIANWPDDAPRGAVTSFCAEHGLSRNTFYKLRRRAEQMGQAAVLEPLSRRPRTSPTALGEQIKDQAAAVRASLASSGLDHGPVSVHDKMKQMGLDAPSPAWLARLFRERGLARIEPSKKPRAAWRRFVYPAPNACWQMDATAYVLAGGRTCVIFQLIDDHSRLALASHVAWGERSDAAIAVVSKAIAAHGVPQRLLTIFQLIDDHSRYAVASHVATSETAEAAIVVFDKAVAAHGVPQRLLSDNGLALNPSRRGVVGQLVAHVAALGTEAITGKPYKPTTQGKNERFHQTLFRYLDKQPIAETLAELQAQVDTFDHIYNTRRPHQGLPGRITPLAAWEATPKAEPPRPKPDHPAYKLPVSPRYQLPRARPPTDLPAETRVRTVATAGTIGVDSVTYMVDTHRAFQQVLVVSDSNKIVITDLLGEVLAEHTRPAPGTNYVGNGRPRGPRRTGDQTSPMS